VNGRHGAERDREVPTVLDIDLKLGSTERRHLADRADLIIAVAEKDLNPIGTGARNSRPAAVPKNGRHVRRASLHAALPQAPIASTALRAHVWAPETKTP
jgi:hypothetical protein